MYILRLDLYCRFNVTRLANNLAKSFWQKFQINLLQNANDILRSTDKKMSLFPIVSIVVVVKLQFQICLLLQKRLLPNKVFFLHDSTFLFFKKKIGLRFGQDSLS